MNTYYVLMYNVCEHNSNSGQVNSWLVTHMCTYDRIQGKMPAFQQQRWHDYKIVAQPSDIKRIILGAFLWTHLLPYFYGTNIQFDLVVWRFGKEADKSIRCEWELCSPDDKKRFGHGDSQLNASIYGGFFYNFNKYAINIGRLSICRQYKVRYKLTDSKETSDFMTVAEFTLKDLDDFYAQYVLPIFVYLFIGFIGGVIGWVLRGGK